MQHAASPEILKCCVAARAPVADGALRVGKLPIRGHNVLGDTAFQEQGWNISRGKNL